MTLTAKLHSILGKKPAQGKPLTLTIDVTQADIDNAVTQSSNLAIPMIPSCCPIAQAARRQFPQDPVCVGLTSVSCSTRRYLVQEKDACLMLSITKLKPEQWSRYCKPVTIHFDENYY